MYPRAITAATARPIPSARTPSPPPLSEAEIAEASGLRAKHATLFLEGPIADELEVAAEKVVASGSFDGTSSESRVVRTTQGLLVARESTQHDGSSSKSSELGRGRFRDGRSFLLMNRAGFRFALARGTPATPSPERIAYIKQMPEAQLVDSEARLGTRAVLFNGSELYAVTPQAAGEKWTRILLHDAQNDPWILR